MVEPSYWAYMLYPRTLASCHVRSIAVQRTTLVIGLMLLCVHVARADSLKEPFDATGQLWAECAANEMKLVHAPLESIYIVLKTKCGFLEKKLRPPLYAVKWAIFT